MRRPEKKREYRRYLRPLPPLQLPLLCAAFLLGCVLAYICAQLLGSSETLRVFIERYAVLNSEGLPAPSLWQLAVAYLRCPVFALVLGFSVFSVWALPLLLLVQGFSLSFAVAAMSLSLGRPGVLLALAVFGLRGVVTLVVSLLLSLWSLQRITASSQQKSLHQNTARLGFCGLALVPAMIAEMTIVPHLISLALQAL